MMKYHNFSLTEINNMIPFEREVYMLLIKEDIERQKKEHEEA